MKCPACSNTLTEIQVGALKVDVCQGGCGGIWFDAFELKRVDEESEAAGEPLLRIRRDERLQVDPTRKRECPRCTGVKLMRHRHRAGSQVEVDECPNCGGYWLDDGELARIRAEQSQMGGIRRPGGQGISIEVIRYLYRFHTEQSKRPPLF